MKRNHPINYHTHSLFDKDLLLKTAFHEAGHAAAIHLNNQQKNLPPVYFQINLRNNSTPNLSNSNPIVPRDKHYIAQVIEGRLIQNLPFNIIESSMFYSNSEKDSIKSAFEADIVNLLAGPLAEAKYLALKSGQRFDLQNIEINTLHQYGGSSDLENIQEYLDDFIADKSRHSENITRLLREAFEFINTAIYWQAIERLAYFIGNSTENEISCETVIDILDG